MNNHIKSKNLYKLYKHLDKISYDSFKTTKQNTRKVYPLIQNKYIDNSLLSKAKKHNNVDVYKIKVNRTECVLYYYKIDEYKIDINKLIDKISYIISLSKSKHKINIHLVLLEDKKIFDKKFESKNTNSGLTYKYGNNMSDIFVYRYEEYMKVLIHELLHALRFSNITNDNKTTNYYNKKYNIKCDEIIIDESYTEIMAKLLNCYICCKYSKTNNYKYFNKLLSIEKRFCSIQASKILDYIKDNPKININKHTHIVEYYLITNELFYNLDKFLENRLRDKDIFRTTKKNMINFVLNNNEYETVIINKKSKMYKTFRMTIIECE